MLYESKESNVLIFCTH